MVPEILCHVPAIARTACIVVAVGLQSFYLPFGVSSPEANRGRAAEAGACEWDDGYFLRVVLYELGSTSYCLDHQYNSNPG
jgi:hypothetical protein